ncbi:MAG: CDP-alcohol phosphatidyltransferase family protein [Acidobacteria bacterium]|nr:CDP-alcohol phosphatidyltransferase family protein [Acidobacteriota bacterium]
MFKLKDSVTTLSLLVSVASIVLAFDGRIALASFLVFVAWGFDALDGLVARLTNTRNQFGAQFDDLADHVAYTLAPGFLAFAALRPFQFWAAAAAGFATILLGTIRLARANTLALRYPGYWIGIPRPVSGFVIVLLLNARLLAGEQWAWAQAAAVILVAAGGLTRWPYKNHKGRLRSIERAFPIVAIASSLAAYPAGWMWDLGLFWAVLYLVSPWVIVPAGTRRAINLATTGAPGGEPAVLAD